MEFKCTILINIILNHLNFEKVSKINFVIFIKFNFMLKLYWFPLTFVHKSDQQEFSFCLY